jgi:branched-chain amino acid transport system permease protein
MAALFGVLLGAPTLRLRGDYLAIVTLGFGEIIRIFMNNLDRPVNITNGPQGINLIQPVRLAGVDFSKAHDWFGVRIPSLYLYYYLFAIMAVLIVIVCLRLQHSRIGRAWVAIREDEIAAKAMGINTRNVKLLAFAMGASFGGVSGALFASFQGFVSPESFTFWESIYVLAIVVLGGMGHVPGVILGGLLLVGFQELLRALAVPVQMKLFGQVLIDAEVLRQLLFGAAMVAIMLYRPAGLWPAPRKEDRPQRVRAAGT